MNIPINKSSDSNEYHKKVGLFKNLEEAIATSSDANQQQKNFFQKRANSFVFNDGNGGEAVNNSNNGNDQ